MIKFLLISLGFNLISLQFLYEWRSPVRRQSPSDWEPVIQYPGLRPDARELTPQLVVSVLAQGSAE